MDEDFGGDSNSITLFGQDAGAASINYLISTSLTTNLFNRVILQSGSMLSPLALDYNPIETASSIAKDFGFNSTDPNKLLEFFKHVPVEDLVKATYKDSKNDAFAQYIFRPCVEASEEGAVITAKPYHLLQSTKSDIEVIVGYNNKEGLTFASKYNYTGYRSLFENLTPIIPDNINFTKDDDKMNFIQSWKIL